MSPQETTNLLAAPDFKQPPQRVISLVPSMTETLFDLGFGESVIGITDFCVHPVDKLSSLPRLGGPKNPQIDAIIELKPDLVLVNQEENTPQVVTSLQDADLTVWMTFPQSVDQALDVMRALLGIYHTDAPAMLINSLQMALDWAKNASDNQEKIKCFCPIWQDKTKSGHEWWMTFNQATYTHDLLAILGVENIFAGRDRKYPLDADLGLTDSEDPGIRDTRYPRVTLQEIEAAQPELILLPSEPFNFEGSHKLAFHDLLSSTPAVKNDRILFIDGSLLTWHGTRLAKAVNDLPALLTL